MEDGSYPVYTNPWNELALFERREIEVLFNNTNFEASQRKLYDFALKFINITENDLPVFSNIMLS